MSAVNSVTLRSPRAVVEHRHRRLDDNCLTEDRVFDQLRTLEYMLEASEASLDDRFVLANRHQLVVRAWLAELASTAQPIGVIAARWAYGFELELELAVCLR